MGVVVSVAVKKQQTRLSGDRHTYLVGELEPATSLEMLLPEKYLHVAKQLGPIVWGQSPECREIFFDEPA